MIMPTYEVFNSPSKIYCLAASQRYHYTAEENQVSEQA
jgi:hypothetical protein